jgi:hypothetical protein
MIDILTIILFLVFLFLGGLHILWMFGGKWAFDTAIPTDENGEKAFMPGKFATLIVALGLILFGFYYLFQSSFVFNPIPLTISQVIGWIIPAIFFLRAFGDFKYIGAFKKVKHTAFAKMDTRVYSPLCFFIAVLGIVIIL